MHNMLELDIPNDIIAQFLELAVTGEKTQFKNLSIIEEQQKIQTIISNVIDTTFYHYGNVFNHTDPFTIHSDISHKKKSILLIPIDAHQDQKFVVFDQTIDATKEISWIYNVFDDKTDDELKEMYYESSSKSRPCDTDSVQQLTNLPISDKLFQHLPYTKDLYYGLSGVAWDYKPGKALLFPANRIHATGKMQSSKIGCTIQFTAPIGSLEILTSTRNLS